MSFNNDHQEMPPAAVMNDLMGGFLKTQIIAVAADLGIADVLHNGPRSTNEIAEAVGADEGSLRRIMRCLAGLGVFAENEKRQYEQTPLSDTLRSDVPGTLRDFARLFGQEWYRLPFTRLSDFVRNPDGVPFEQVHGMRMFDYLKTDEMAASTFNDAMTSTTQAAESAIIDAYDFTPFEQIVDVGGGHGAMLAAALKSSPESQGTLFDLPEVVSDAPAVLTHAGVNDRCDIVAGSFFDGVPMGADSYILKFILHDWNDEEAKNILKRIREAITPGGKLLLIERGIVPEGNNPDPIKFLDLSMMVLLGGLERTEAGFKHLLNEGGFELNRVIPTSSPRNVLIEATPV